MNKVRFFALRNCGLNDEWFDNERLGAQRRCPKSETNSAESSTSNSQAFRCPCHFVAKGSHSTAASI